jgi:hypothetical protein
MDESATPTPARARRGPRPAARLTAIAALALGLALGTGGRGSAPPTARADESPGAAADTAELFGGVRRADPGAGVLPASERPFGPGESLRFAVQYGFINAGTAWLEVPKAVEVDGRPAYLLVARAESNSVIDKIYRVRNRIESTWDREGRFSWHYEEDRHEGKHRFKSEISFDPDMLEARYHDGQVYPVPPNVQDALSAFYYTRYQALPLGGSILFDYHASRRSQPLEVRVLGRERVKVPAGTFDCVVVEPLLKAGGVFKNSGRLVIWLTDDERRIPVLMRSKVTIGSVSVELQEMRTGT